MDAQGNVNGDILLIRVVGQIAVIKHLQPGVFILKSNQAKLERFPKDQFRAIYLDAVFLCRLKNHLFAAHCLFTVIYKLLKDADPLVAGDQF